MKIGNKVFDLRAENIDIKNINNDPLINDIRRYIVNIIRKPIQKYDPALYNPMGPGDSAPWDAASLYAVADRIFYRLIKSGYTDIKAGFVGSKLLKQAMDACFSQNYKPQANLKRCFNKVLSRGCEEDIFSLFNIKDRGFDFNIKQGSFAFLKELFTKIPNPDEWYGANVNMGIPGRHEIYLLLMNRFGFTNQWSSKSIKFQLIYIFESIEMYFSKSNLLAILKKCYNLSKSSLEFINEIDYVPHMQEEWTFSEICLDPMIRSRCRTIAEMIYSSLNEDEKKLIMDYTVHEKTLEELGRIHKCAPNTIKNRLKSLSSKMTQENIGFEPYENNSRFPMIIMGLLLKKIMENCETNHIKEKAKQAVSHLNDLEKKIIFNIAILRKSKAQIAGELALDLYTIDPLLMNMRQNLISKIGADYFKDKKPIFQLIRQEMISEILNSQFSSNKEAQNEH